jgi:APA family basic amino acid/polyamine antiporter
MASLPWATWERLLVWLGLGLAIYFMYSRRRAREKLGEVAAAGGVGADVDAGAAGVSS